MSIPRELLKDIVWFFDYDGSLCPHQEVWELRAYNPQEIKDVLEHLKNLGSQIYWNTGRRPESLGDVQLDFLDYPGYFIQGAAVWDEKTKKARALAPLLPQDWVKKFTDTELFEEKVFRKEAKPHSFRVAPAQLAFLRELKAKVHSFGAPKGWKWVVGYRGAELLPEGFDKGSAIRLYYENSANSKKIPIAVGDDALDLPAIKECIERGGYGILVGEHCGWITNLPHKAQQLMYFDRPKDLHDYILGF